jgi:hypothetical protein
MGILSQTRTKSPEKRISRCNLEGRSRELLTVPVRDVLVGNSGGDVEHDDAALAVDIVSVTKASELLLSCGIPDIELNVAQVL